MTIKTRILLAGMLLAAAGAFASAQQAQTVRLKGTIEKVAGDTLTLKPDNGADITLLLAEKAQVIAVVASSLADIKEGTFLGSAAMPQPDGSQKALEVHIFPEQMRGTGEGHRPYAPVAGSTMTNGTSGAPVAAVEGSAIMVKYKDGEKKIVVPPGTPIVRYEIGSAADLKPGAHFAVLAATKKPDGSYEAARINVGRDGVVPR
jgi:hypothetical protein